MEPKSVVVTGATGFIGQELVHRLWQAGIGVIGITRTRAEVMPFVPFIMDLLDESEPFADPPAGTLLGLIHLAGHAPGSTLSPVALHETGTARVVELAKLWNIPKVIYVSAQGATMSAPTAFQQSKWLAEEIVAHSGMNFVILRPHLVWGTSSRTSEKLERLGRLPNVKVRPIHVADVAETLIRSLWLDRVDGKRYEMAGPQLMPLESLVEGASRSFMRRRRHVTLRDLDAWGILTPRHNRADGAWVSDFGILPRPVLSTRTH